MDAHTRKDTEGYFISCVDPGGETGMSLFRVQPDSFRLLEYTTVRWRPRAGENPVAVLVDWRLTYPGTHHLLYEDFHLRNTEGAASTDTTPLLVIGAMEQMIYDRGNPYEAIFDQEPVEAKHMVDDEKLERLNLHLNHAYANRHVRDANRHFVTHMTRRRYLPVCRAAYPRRSVRSQRAEALTRPA